MLYKIIGFGISALIFWYFRQKKTFSSNPANPENALYHAVTNSKQYAKYYWKVTISH